MDERGFYTIKGSFFTDMNDPYLEDNKGANRPYYCCFKDARSEIYWVIPISSQVEKYRKIIEERQCRGQPCDILHIAKLDNNREEVFLIQNMFPVTSEYIEREYTLGKKHMVLTSQHTAKEVEKKARKVAGMMKRGIKFLPTQADVKSILSNLHSNLNKK